MRHCSPYIVADGVSRVFLVVAVIFAFTVLLLAAKLVPEAVLVVGRVSWQ